MINENKSEDAFVLGIILISEDYACMQPCLLFAWDNFLNVLCLYSFLSDLLHVCVCVCVTNEC